MATPHKAMPDDWKAVELNTGILPACSCLLELRDRIEALEAAASRTDKESLTVAPAPAGGLVERLMDEGYAVTHARAAILAAADYMDNHDWPNAARWLREEVQRHG